MADNSEALVMAGVLGDEHWDLGADGIPLNSVEKLIRASHLTETYDA